MGTEQKRGRLTPLGLGFVLIFAAVCFVAYRMITEDCGTTPFIDVGVLAAIPVLYLVLMYLALVSQR